MKAHAFHLMVQRNLSVQGNQSSSLGTGKREKPVEKKEAWRRKGAKDTTWSVKKGFEKL